jgi:hypothetical protein
LGPLSQQAPVATDEIGINRLQLKHNTIEPLAAQGGLASHEMQVEGAEAHAAQRTNQVQLSLQWFPVALGLAAAAATQFQFKDLLVCAGCL